MIDYDFHIHTAYCGHAEGMTVEAICRRADELGLKTICIADHIFRPADHAIIKQIRREVERLDTKCKIYIGAEVDVDPMHTDGRFVTDDFDGLDYVIAGFHYVPTVGNYPHRLEECTLDDKTFLTHWKSSLLGVVSNPKINTLAHPGRLLAASVDLEPYFETALAVFREAAKRSAANHIMWEINELTGTRLKDAHKQIWHLIYEVALEAGVKLVYGSDAHHPLAMGQYEFSNFILSQLPQGCLCSAKDVFG